MNNIKNEKWIDLKEAAKHLGIEEGTLRVWIRKDNGIPAQKIGKKWKFKKTKLDIWVKSGKRAI